MSKLWKRSDTPASHQLSKLVIADEPSDKDFVNSRKYEIMGSIKAKKQDRILLQLASGQRVNIQDVKTDIDKEEAELLREAVFRKNISVSASVLPTPTKENMWNNNSVKCEKFCRLQFVDRDIANYERLFLSQIKKRPSVLQSLKSFSPQREALKEQTPEKQKAHTITAVSFFSNNLKTSSILAPHSRPLSNTGTPSKPNARLGHSELRTTSNFLKTPSAKKSVPPISLDDTKMSVSPFFNDKLNKVPHKYNIKSLNTSVEVHRPLKEREKEATSTTQVLHVNQNKLNTSFNTPFESIEEFRVYESSSQHKDQDHGHANKSTVEASRASHHRKTQSLGQTAIGMLTKSVKMLPNSIAESNNQLQQSIIQKSVAIFDPGFSCFTKKETP